MMAVFSVTPVEMKLLEMLQQAAINACLLYRDLKLVATSVPGTVGQLYPELCPKSRVWMW